MKNVPIVFMLWLFLPALGWPDEDMDPGVVPDPTPRGEIGYINPDVPEFAPPTYPGEYYASVVPATLDLAERARLAIHAVTSMTNPNCDYEIYFVASHVAQPPALLHGNGDLACHGKFMEVLPLLRAMSGSLENMEVETTWMKVLLQLQGPDGLIYASTIGRPWILPPNFDPGSGCRALFSVWRDMIAYEEGKLRVNLLLNRVSKWADIESYIPYTGRVDVKVKEKIDLELRIPEWVGSEQVHCEVDGQARQPGFDGRHAQVGEVGAGQVVTMTFPISERTEKVNIEGFDYTLIIRGNDVVSIDPPGRYAPMYQRAHYRSEEPLYRKVKRFVSDDEFSWW